MQKQFKSLLIWGLVLIVLVGAYLIATIAVPAWKKPEETTQSTQPALEPILKTDFATVSFLEVVNDFDTYRLLPQSRINEKGEEEWAFTIEGYEGYPFSESLLRDLANVADEAFVKKEIEPEGTDLSPFGLDKPLAVLRVVHKNGQTHEIRFGTEVPSDNYYYTTLDDTGRVALIASMSFNRVNSALMDLLDKNQMIGFNPDALTEISLSRAKDNLYLKMDVEGKGEPGENFYLSFRLNDPFDWAINTDNMNKLVNEIMSMSPKSFVALDPDDLSIYGLDNPVYEFGLTSAGRTTVLQLGGQAGNGMFYAMSSNLPAVFTVPAGTFTLVDLKATELIDRFVSLESIWTVSGIEFELDDTRFVVEIDMEEDQKPTDEDVLFRLDGQDARILSERKRSLFSTFYQRLISIVIEGLDLEADPINTKDGTMVFHYKADLETNQPRESKTIEFARRNQYTYFVFIDGVYTGFYINAEQAFTSDRPNNEGILTAYKHMQYAIEHASDLVFDTEKGYAAD